MKSVIGRKRHHHHLRPARRNHPLVSGVDRLGNDDLVVRSDQGLQRAIKPALGARGDHDVVGGAGLAGAARETRRDRRT
jgi:hypothetical protein